MPVGRRTQPLFDLIRGAGDRTGPAAPHTPAAVAPAADTVPNGEEAWTTGAEGWLDAKRTISMPVARLYFAAAGVIIVLALVWLVAYRTGYTTANRELEPYLNRETSDPNVNDPLEGRSRQALGPDRSGPSGAGQGDPAKPSPKPDPGSQGQPPSPAPPKPTPPKPAPPKDEGTRNPPKAPMPPPDTRVAGHNYLLIAANLPLSEARRAALFLTENGVPCAAVPVDPGAEEAKDPPSNVYSLMGIPGAEYSSRWKERTDHQREVARLGQIWQKQHKGSSNFAQSQTMWQKYKP